jgi:hypothetical protein
MTDRRGFVGIRQLGTRVVLVTVILFVLVTAVGVVLAAANALPNASSARHSTAVRKPRVVLVGCLGDLLDAP